MKKGTVINRKVSPTYLEGLYQNWRYKELLAELVKNCEKCGSTDKISYHRKILISEIIKENNINDVMSALRCPKLFDPDNGIALCEDCYRKFRHDFFDYMKSML